MKDLQPPLKELAQKLTPSLAFAALMVFVGIVYREQIPAPWRVVPYLLAVLGVVVNVLIEVIQARAKSQPAEVGKAEVQGNAQHSILVTGHKNQVTLIVNEYAKTHPTDKEALQKKLDTYLEWAEEIFGVVVLRGIEQGGRQVVNLPLDTVYVPLQAEYQQDDLREMGTAKRGGKKLEEEMLRLEKQPRKSEQIVLNKVLSLGNRLIITGGPGSGKTTVLRHIAWALAKALRGTAPTLAKEKLGLAAPLPLPVYIPLSQYAAYRRNLPASATGHQKSLATFISDYMATRQEYLAPEPDFFAHLLQQQKDVLLLLDGLDEVPTEMEREKVSQAIEDLVAGREHLRVVVTSRIAAYRGNVVLGRGFQEVRVLPLSAEQINNLVRQAFRSIYPGGMREAEVRAEKLLANIQTLEAERQQRLGDSASRLVDSPLMVRILLIVYYNERELPDQRADLYQKAVDAMLKPDYALDREVTHEIEKRVGGSLAMNRGMLQFLAFHMHQQGKEQGREIGEVALRNAFEKEPTYAPYVDELIAQTRQRGTLLEEYGNQYRFLHLSFQEFLVGRHLAQNVQDLEQIARFLEAGLILDSWWREPVLLMVGYQDMIEPVQARRLLMRLAGVDDEASQRPKLPYEVELAMAEIAGIAYKECKNQAEDLGTSLTVRLLDRIHHPPSQIQPPTPIYLANAADALDRLGWLPEDLYEFVEISPVNQQTNKLANEPTNL
ncbi:MAG TPA: NACHT domain-containing protein, partial [Anaerolineales bacterium]|nr:NACHT domain-containing protein [Anaerolineales bacterium]